MAAIVQPFRIQNYSGRCPETIGSFVKEKDIREHYEKLGKVISDVEFMAKTH
jgi:hypothetical protein